jgi:MtN3 and saliva related transmembrane protein
MIRYVGYFAGLLTVLAFLPQVARTWRSRKTKDLSLGTFGLLFSASACWIGYGIARHDWPVIATNVGTLVLNASLIVAKLKYK